MKIPAACLSIVLLSAIPLLASNDLRLVEAAQRQDQAAVAALLKQHVNVNASQPDGSTALSWAAHWDDADTVELLLRAGADPNKANDYGVTPLALACAKGNAAIIEKLLKAGANPNIAEWSGETPLMTCARTGSTEAMKLLLSYKADVNAKNRRGQTALMWAAAEKHPETVQALVEFKADPNAMSHLLEGFQPQEYISYGIYEHVPGDGEDFAGSRKKDGPIKVNPDPATSKGGFTALMFAAQQDDIVSARILLAAGANVNVASPQYGSALTVASASGHEKFALFLLEKGADPNIADGFGIYPLHYALQEGITLLAMSRARIPSDSSWLIANMPGLVKALLEHGANTNVRIGRGFPAFDQPAYGRTTGNSLPQLRQEGATPLLLAAGSYDAGLMRLLKASGADPLIATEEGTTPLMVAAGMGRYENFGKEEAQKALEAVNLLLEWGADVNAANHGGRTALQGAVYMGANPIVQLLVEKGANLDAKDKYGQTALSIASGRPAGDGLDKRFHGSRGHKDTAELLLKLGAAPLPPAKPRYEEAAADNGEKQGSDPAGF